MRIDPHIRTPLLTLPSPKKLKMHGMGFYLSIINIEYKCQARKIHIMLFGITEYPFVHCSAILAA
jgi:hypothetical protein